MTDIKLTSELKNRLKLSGVTFRFWIKKYLPNYDYSLIWGQVNGHFTIQNYTRTAIEKYLKD